jgi:hypothetical protein
MKITVHDGRFGVDRGRRLTACPAAATFGDMFALPQTRISVSAALLGRGLLLRA